MCWRDKDQPPEEIWKGLKGYDYIEVKLKAYRGKVVLRGSGKAVVIHGRTGKILAQDLKLPKYEAGDSAFPIGNKVVYIHDLYSEGKVYFGSVSYGK